MARVADLPPDSVRGRIRNFILENAGSLGGDVIEFGARRHDPAAWWTSCRDIAAGDWLCTDLQPGENVDQVHDMELPPPAPWRGRFSGALCSEVLEHVRDPRRALVNVGDMLRPGGVLIVTTLTAFPIHAFPNDYRRWTESGLRAELEDAGFSSIETQAAGSVEFHLNDHGEARITRLTCPVHVFATAQKPGSIVPSADEQPIEQARTFQRSD